MKLLNPIIDKLQAAFPPNRVVALALTVLVPLVIAPAAGYVAIWLPVHFPDLPVFTAVQLTAFGIAGAGTALLTGVVAGYKYIDGWQQHEWREHEAELLDRKQVHAERVALIEAGHVPVDAFSRVEADGLGPAPLEPVESPPPPPPAA